MMAFLEMALAFVLAHQALLAALAVAAVDLVFALAPGLASNGLLHWLYLLLKGKAEAPKA